MSPSIVIFKSIFFVILFAFSCLLLGKSLPKTWLISNRLEHIQRILIGFSILIVALRFPYREDLPISISASILFLIAAYATAKWIYELSCNSVTLRYLTEINFLQRLSAPKILSIVSILPSLLIIYYPLITSHAVFFQNHGPDLDGDLLAASFIYEGHTWDRLMFSLHQATGSFKWWHLDNHPWFLSDFREAVAIEFFPRSLRWGHAVVTAAICWVTGEPIWFSFFVLTIFSIVLCPLVITDTCLSRGIGLRTTVILSTGLMATQTYALMLYEGVVVQLIATPFLLFLTLNFKKLLFEYSNIGQKIFVALMLSALVSTFGEGIQILAVLAVSYLAVYYCTARRYNLTEASPFISALIMTGLWILISPTVFADFILWSLARLKQAFAGGALHFNWSIFSLFFPLNYMQLTKEGLQLVVEGTTYTRILETSILLSIGGYLIYRKKPPGFDFMAASIAILVFVLVNHLYAIWKILAIYQPLLFLSLFQALDERFNKFLSKEQLLGAFAVFSSVGLFNLLTQYQNLSQHAHLEQFQVNKDQVAGRKYALLTPSLSRVYLKLGSHGELHWTNGGWRGPIEPNFSLTGNANLPIALYFDCDAEGKSRCDKIREFAPNLIPRTLHLTETPVSTLLDQQGVINRTLVNQYIKQNYGIDAAGGERQPD